MSTEKNKKTVRKLKLPLVAEPLHARLKMIAIGKGMTFDNFISESLWSVAKNTPLNIPQQPKMVRAQGGE